MRLRHVAVAASSLAVVAVVACSTSTAAPATTDAGSPDSGAPTEECAIPPGTYKVHRAREARSSVDCRDVIPDGLVVISAADAQAPDFYVDMANYRDDECSRQNDRSTCTFTISCQHQGGGAFVQESVMLVTKGSITGSSEYKNIRDNPEPGVPPTECAYEFTYARQ